MLVSMTAVLTPKGEATRHRIIEAAAEEMRENGVAVTTLDDVRNRAHVSKGQLFHYFPDGKEELLLAVAGFEAGRVLDDQQPQLGNLTSWAAWTEWRDVVVARYRAQGMDCPLSALMSQVGRSTPGAKVVVSQLMGQWEALIRAGIEELQASGEADADLDAAQVGAALIAGIQGGVGMLMTTGSTHHLEAAIDLVLDRLSGGARSV
jgi:AcrR family transcriptional regulator